MKQSEYAKLCGVSRQVIGKMVRKGQLIAPRGDIDEANPVNRAYIERRKMAAAPPSATDSYGARRIAEALAEAAVRREAAGLPELAAEPDLAGKVEPDCYLSVMAIIDGREHLVERIGFAEPLLDEISHVVGPALSFAIAIDWAAEALTRADTGEPVPSKWIRAPANRD